MHPRSIGRVRDHDVAAPVSPLNDIQKVLLWADHAPWPDQTNVADSLTCSEGMVLHQVHAYQRACASQACKAMHSYCARSSVTDVQESAHDVDTWHSAVVEKHLVVRQPMRRETGSIIPRQIVQANNVADPSLCKLAEEFLWIMVEHGGILTQHGQALLPWADESDEFGSDLQQNECFSA